MARAVEDKREKEAALKGKSSEQRAAPCTGTPAKHTSHVTRRVARGYALCSANRCKRDERRKHQAVRSSRERWSSGSGRVAAEVARHYPRRRSARRIGRRTRDDRAAVSGRESRAELRNG